eukprot:TRINITY_DN11948_c0_g1_i2.p1 TRINITY_DN11948_c0_g1~~TRINITY_DN11948_c0_g1_i2.p1  ORF type:complete len:528 (-),score=117.34 TRINITY_DN11948_c0_g1_i2:16-1599(-)
MRPAAVLGCHAADSRCVPTAAAAAELEHATLSRRKPLPPAISRRRKETLADGQDGRPSGWRSNAGVFAAAFGVSLCSAARQRPGHTAWGTSLSMRRHREGSWMPRRAAGGQEVDSDQVETRYMTKVWEVFTIKQSTREAKAFLLDTFRDAPDWYRLIDLFASCLGAICFYIKVVEPKLGATYHASQVEDLVNVSFLVKFLLLFWSNEWQLSWFFTGRAALDFASCLPVIGIVARYFMGPENEKTLELLQLARFLRLLGQSLPRKNADGSQINADALQIVTVLVALLGTVGVSATLMFLYENPSWLEGIAPYRSFDDTVLYMVNVFASRDLPFDPRTLAGKQATSAATLVSILFLPFLVSISVETFQGANQAVGGAMKVFGGGFVFKQKTADDKVLQAAAEETSPMKSPAYWAAVIKRIDRLGQDRLLDADEARTARGACLQKKKQLYILDCCYGWSCLDAADSDDPADSEDSKQADQRALLPPPAVSAAAPDDEASQQTAATSVLSAEAVRQRYASRLRELICNEVL